MCGYTQVSYRANLGRSFRPKSTVSTEKSPLVSNYVLLPGYNTYTWVLFSFFLLFFVYVSTVIDNSQARVSQEEHRPVSIYGLVLIENNLPNLKGSLFKKRDLLYFFPLLAMVTLFQAETSSDALS